MGVPLKIPRPYIAESLSRRNAMKTDQVPSCPAALTKDEDGSIKNTSQFGNELDFYDLRDIFTLIIATSKFYNQEMK